MKPKIYIRIIRIILIITILLNLSCETETEFNTDLKSSIENIQDIPFNEILKNDNFFSNCFKNINNLKKNNKSTHNDFEIIKESVRVINSGKSVNYVMLIRRNIETKNSFENLIIQKKTNQTYRYLLVKYNLDKEYNQDFLKDSENGLHASIEITNIDKQNLKSTADCITILMNVCNYGGEEHLAGARCTKSYTKAFTYCSSDGGESSPVNIDSGIIINSNIGSTTNNSQSGGNQSNISFTQIDFGTMAYMPPRQFLDEEGNLMEDPYGYNDEMMMFLSKNPNIKIEINNYLRNNPSINDKLNVNNAIGFMILNNALTFQQALALNYYTKINQQHAEFIFHNQNTAVQIAKYIIQNNYSQDAIAFVKQLITYCIANPDTLLTPFPFFKYPLNSNYQTLYPNFTILVKEYIPKLKNEQSLINAIHNLTNVSPSTIVNELQWGNGAEINITQLGLDTNGNPYYGKFNKNEPNKIFIDIDLVNQLELLSNISNPTPAQNQQIAYLNAMITFSVCLHEYVHFSDFAFDGTMQDNENLELGLLFEQIYLGGYYEFDLTGNVIFIKKR